MPAPLPRTNSAGVWQDAARHGGRGRGGQRAPALGDGNAHRPRGLRDDSHRPPRDRRPQVRRPVD
eukprot:3439661-Pyramimonas_sp.AAC.1